MGISVALIAVFLAVFPSGLPILQALILLLFPALIPIVKYFLKTWISRQQISIGKYAPTSKHVPCLVAEYEVDFPYWGFVEKDVGK